MGLAVSRQGGPFQAKARLNRGQRAAESQRKSGRHAYIEAPTLQVGEIHEGEVRHPVPARRAQVAKPR